MSYDIRQLPETVGQYEILIAISDAHFGSSLEILEQGIRARVEHGLGRNCGGFTLVVFNPKLEQKLRFRTKRYLYRCQREAMLTTDRGTLYALISLEQGEVRDVSENNEGPFCTHAVCVISHDKVLVPRLYLLPPNEAP